ISDGRLSYQFSSDGYIRRSVYAYEITVKTQQLRQMNQHNGWLLEGQIERNQQALEMLKPHQEPTLYGANGQTSTTHRGGKKISI
ncbi:flagellar export chaperone FlgN, partial [Escherichia coli]|nr:flagellar export chaperone FlgN [Escherichia coli]